MTRGRPNLANPSAQEAIICFPQADGLEKEPELNGKKDGVLQDKGQAAGPDKADIQELEAKGEVSPEGQGAAQAAVEYLGAPLPPNEKERHETLCACQILDTAPDPRFDDITKLVRLFPSAMEPCCGPVSDVHTLRSVLLCEGEAVALLYLFCSCACSSCVAMEAWHLLLPACLVMSLSGSIQPC